MNSNIFQKNNFLLHHDALEILKELTDEQAGKLIKEIYRYSLELQNPEEPKKPSGLNGLLECIAHPFKMQLERDFVKYLNVVERNRKNGQNGGRPPEKKTQAKPKKPDNDKENDKENDIVIEKNIKKEIVSQEVSEIELEDFVKKHFAKATPQVQDTTFSFVKNTLLVNKPYTKENILRAIQECIEKFPESYGLKEVSETKNQNSSSSEIPNNSISAKNTQVQLAVQSLPAELTDSLIEDDIKAIDLWLNFKKEQRKPYKSSSIPILVKKLKELAKQSNATMRQIVEQSIASNYQGLFPLKQTTNQQNYDRNKKLAGLNISENSILGQYYSSGSNKRSAESEQRSRDLEEEARKLGIGIK